MGLKLLGPPDGFSKTLQNFQFGGDRASLPVARRSVGHVCNKRKSSRRREVSLLSSRRRGDGNLAPWTLAKPCASSSASEGRIRMLFTRAFNQLVPVLSGPTPVVASPSAPHEMI